MDQSDHKKLPSRTQPIPEAAATNALSAVGPHVTPVLIVDDDPDLCEALGDLLEPEGYRIDTVGRAAEAIQQAQTIAYGAVLLDLRLPDLDGQAVLKALTELDSTLPVIILTGFPTTENTVRSLVKGAFACLTKPYNPDVVKATLRRAVAVKRLAVEAERVENALTESEERFRSLVESATDAIVVGDEQGHMVSWNHAAQSLFGYSAGEVLGRPLTMLMPLRYREAHQRGLERVSATGATRVIGKTVELHGLRRDGVEFPLELSLARWNTKEGRFYSGIIRDITERKQAQAALRDAYQKTQTILASLPGAILILNDNHEAVYANSLAEDYFGTPPPSLVGRSLFDILPLSESRRFSLSANLRSPMSEEAKHLPEGEFEIRKRMYWYRLFPVTLVPGGRRQTGLVIQDITEQRLLQDQLIHAEKLASLGTLVSGMAHEINNPVQGILGMAELILQEHDPVIIQEYAQDIVRCARHTATVVRDFVSYARPASSGEEDEICLGERLADAVKMIRLGPDFGHVDVVTEFEAVPPVCARRGEIDQVFLNLISNAVQAMQGSGRLTLATRRIDDTIAVQISDTGGGIPKNHLARIFDPFFTTKAPGKGTGLGLSIVYKIVNKYGGTISVDSEEGNGTTFTIRFPTGEHHKEVRNETAQTTGRERHDGSRAAGG